MVSGWASSCLRYDKKFEQDTTPAVAIAHGESMARAKSRAKFLVLTSYFMVEWLLCEFVEVATR